VDPLGLRKGLENIFSIPELVRKLLFTLALLCIYRIGFHVPLAGLNQDAIESMMARQSDQGNPFSQAIQYMQIFTGGTLDKSSLFGLGIMPYITASIILMLLGEVVPSLKKLRQEGQVGHKKIQEYTRYLTVLICVMQALMYMNNQMMGQFFYTGMEVSGRLMGVIGMTAGTIFLMWLGEQIDEYGIGNGISLIIMAGIISRMPWAVMRLVGSVDLTAGRPGRRFHRAGPKIIFLLLAMFVAVVAGAILITQGQRRIPIQQAKMMKGRRMYGGQRTTCPCGSTTAA
jgi:preprotein translocase subunit SecY